MGATLAEWQRKRAEEEAARLAALRNSGGGGDEGGDGGGRTNAGRKAYQAMMQEKRIVGALQAEQNAKAQAAIAKAAQADMTQEEKLSAYKQTAGYVARQESNAEYERQKALEAQRAGERNAVSIAEEYKSQVREKQSAVSAARWAGVASVAKGKQDSEEENKTWLQKAWENTKSPPNWCQVVIYPVNADCYASGGSTFCMQYPDTDVNDIDGDSDEEECVP